MPKLDSDVPLLLMRPRTLNNNFIFPTDHITSSIKKLHISYERIFHVNLENDACVAIYKTRVILHTLKVLLKNDDCV